MTLSTPNRQRQLSKLVSKLGLTDTSAINWALLDRALTHPTFSSQHYEQLEFVGDAVLRLAASEILLNAYPHMTEGELSGVRAVVVSDRILAQIATRYNLDRYILMGASARCDTSGKETRLAAAFEALLAALYLSTRNFSLIDSWFNDCLRTFADIVQQDPALQNYKGALQRLTQARYRQLPEYQVSEVGTAHGDKERFLAEVWLQGKQWGQGKGQSKKAAEQVAAQAALTALQAATDTVSPDQ